MAKEKEQYDKCPKCGSIFIEYNPCREEIHCLVKKCHYREHVDYSKIKDMKIDNIYLRTTIPSSSEALRDRKALGALEAITLRERQLREV